MIDITAKTERLTDLRNSNPITKKLNRTSQISKKDCIRILSLYSSDPKFSVIFNQIAKSFKDDQQKIIKWFFALNPWLNNVRPIELIIWGKTESLLDFILNAKNSPYDK